MDFDRSRLKTGPENEDGLPVWVEWDGERFDTPDIDQVGRWIIGSVCESIEGDRIEPDGVTFSGCPSWLLVLGFA